MEQTGTVVVEKVGDKSTVTRCYSKYPLKFIVPKKLGNSKTDAVWIYTLTYGGGIVSGDSISCDFTIGDGCTTVLTTQASTKVYKSLGSKCSVQVLEARVGNNALLAVIPDPVTCFSTARYTQKQVFRMLSDASLIVVDWVTSGRHESGEKWDFDLYKSTNHIFLEDNEPLLLDTVLLEKGSMPSIVERMQEYQVVAMVIFWGPKMKHIQNQVQEEVRRMMTEQLQFYSPASAQRMKRSSTCCTNKPNFIVSSSVFGPQGKGVVVRIVATTTESVYTFLQHQLAGLEPLLGLSPYH
ncbi:Urease accessory protein UreD [Morus notabilis]|uniref:Urease accessory protein UreD n=1 Tax=Morus notabilis TaxID=981085 RepID=W9S3K8_9ROSA|nr:urease accessory protein D [Morus notabilis]EXC24807.1 Urease accessory protein UreD [Morus notabilis]